MVLWKIMAITFFIYFGQEISWTEKPMVLIFYFIKMRPRVIHIMFVDDIMQLYTRDIYTVSYTEWLIPCRGFFDVVSSAGGWYVCLIDVAIMTMECSVPGAFSVNVDLCVGCGTKAGPATVRFEEITY